MATKTGPRTAAKASGLPSAKAASEARAKGLTGARKRSYVGGAIQRAKKESGKESGTERGGAGRTASAGRGVAVRSIPVSQIHTGLNPREHFDPAGIDELAQSIGKNGLLQPVTVRRHNGGYQLIAGERRFRAIRKLGLATVPAIVRDVSDEQARHLAILENINRQDMTPTETGRAYRQLLTGGQSVDELQQQFGKSREHINEHVALVNLEPDIQQAVDKGYLAFSLVAPLSRLTPKQRREAAGRIVSEGLSVSQGKTLIRQLQARDAQIGMFDMAATPKPTRQAVSAREKFRKHVDTLTAAFAQLDDETVEMMLPALENPRMEHQRFDLIIKQARRIQRNLERAALAREVRR